MQPPINVIKIENPGYYCNSYTPPAQDHGSMLPSAQYSPLPLPRSAQSPSEPRTKRVRRLSSAEEEMELGNAGGGSREKQGAGGPAEVGYYGQSPASLSSQTSWHSDVDHGLPSQHGNVAPLSTATYYQQSENSPAKYPENGHDTLSDFVTFVCQEAENAQNQESQNVILLDSSISKAKMFARGMSFYSSAGPSRSPNKLTQYYPSSMLPPPPPPPMARPVAIIRSTGELNVSGGGSGGGSSPQTPPNEGSPPRSPNGQGGEAPQHSRTLVSSPFSRDYPVPFTHIHTQPAQLFSYPSLSPMSGVMSPTNLSLFPGPLQVNSPRGGTRSALPRWTPPTAPPAGPGPPFISLEEDYMMTPLITTTNHETATLIDDDRYFNSVVQNNDGIESTLGTGSNSSGTSTSPKGQGTSPKSS